MIRSAAPGVVTLPDTPVTSSVQPVKIGATPVIIGLGANNQNVLGGGGNPQIPPGVVVKKQNEL